MAKIIDVDGHRFEIPDDEYTGVQLQERAKMEGDAVPVIRRAGKDIAVEPNETVRLEPDDNVIFTTPVESAHEDEDRQVSPPTTGSNQEERIRG